jgi:hypothetical protein
MLCHARHTTHTQREREREREKERERELRTDASGALSRYTKNTLDYASQMCVVAEKKKKSVNGIVPPDRWSKTKFMEWLGALEGGRFSKYVEIMQINGATMQNMPLSGKEGLTARFEADKVPFAKAEADAKVAFLSCSL